MMILLTLFCSFFSFRTCQVFISAEGRIKIADFGSATLRDDEEDDYNDNDEDDYDPYSDSFEFNFDNPSWGRETMTERRGVSEGRKSRANSLGDGLSGEVNARRKTLGGQQVALGTPMFMGQTLPVLFLFLFLLLCFHHRTLFFFFPRLSTAFPR